LIFEDEELNDVSEAVFYPPKCNTFNVRLTEFRCQSVLKAWTGDREATPKETIRDTAKQNYRGIVIAESRQRGTRRLHV